MQELEAAKCDVYIEHTRVTHEKIVKALTKCTSSTSGWADVVPIRTPAVATRVLVGLSDQMVSHSSVLIGTLLTSTPVSQSGTWICGLRLDHDPGRMTGTLFLFAPSFG